jgi:hypothetical protein
MKELKETNLETVDRDLQSEIRSICNLILETIPEKKLILEVSLSQETETETETDNKGEEKEEVQGIQRGNKTVSDSSSDSLSSTESFDNISELDNVD